jgi:hypothetical protein
VNDARVLVDTDAEAGEAIFLDVAVSFGQRLVTVFDYTITPSNRGLDYPRPRTIYCMPITAGPCIEPSVREERLHRSSWALAIRALPIHSSA